MPGLSPGLNAPERLDDEASSVQAFKMLLLGALSHLKQLLSLLDEENQQLAVGFEQPEALEQLTAKKNQLLAQLEEDVRQRQAFLLAGGFSPDSEGLEAFLAALQPASAQALQQGWQKLVHLFARVHQQNTANGFLINRGLRHYEALLNALQASQVSQPAGKIYRPSGGATGLNIPRHLGKA